MSYKGYKQRKHAAQELDLFATCGCRIPVDDIPTILMLECTIEMMRNPVVGDVVPTRVLTREGAYGLVDIIDPGYDRDALLALADRFECGSALYMTGQEVADAIRRAVGT